MYNTDLNNRYLRLSPRTVHAEVHAVEKIHRLKKNARVKKVDVVVFRVLGGNTISADKTQFGMAKSCHCCKHHLQTQLISKGYTVRGLYYTDDTGQIVRDTL